MVEGIHWKLLLVIILLSGMGLLIQFVSRMSSIDVDKKMIELIDREYRTHTKMQEEDLYKFLHQAAMGSEHAVKDSIMAKNWMSREIAGLDLNIKNKLIDTLSASGNLVRVNLRPFLEEGNDPDKLVNAFIRTANSFNGSADTLKRYLSIARRMIKRNQLPLDLDKLNNLTAEMEPKNFPAIHHSKKYEETYKPAYRVVASEYLTDLLKK